VLELDPAKTIKLILVGIRHQTEGIEEDKGDWAPSSLEKSALSAVREVCATGEGANAAAEPARAATTVIFIIFA